LLARPIEAVFARLAPAGLASGKRAGGATGAAGTAADIVLVAGGRTSPEGGGISTAGTRVAAASCAYAACTHIPRIGGITAIVHAAAVAINTLRFTASGDLGVAAFGFRYNLGAHFV